MMHVPTNSLGGFPHSAQTSFSALGDYTRVGRQSSFQLLRPPTDAVSTPGLDSTQDYIYALDSATTKLKVPLSAVEPTKAFEDDGLVPGLCRLFLKGSCRQGPNCFQVHANPSVIEKLREEALQTPSCCHFHGAPWSFAGLPCGTTVTIEGWEYEKENCLIIDGTDDSTHRRNLKPFNSENVPFGGMERESGNYVLSAQNLSLTNYLWAQYKNSGSMHLKVPSRKVCREHLKGLCRFGDACNFLHGCRAILTGNHHASRSMYSKANASDPAFNHGNGSFNHGLNELSNSATRQSSYGSFAQGGPLHYSINFCTSTASSLDSRRIESNASSKSTSFSLNPEQLLKPFANRAPFDNSCSHSSTYFSHNPYAYPSL